MSAICSGNPSVPNTGVPAALVIDAPYIQSLLPSGLAWLYPYLDFMHGLEIGDVGAFCAAEPPTWTVPSAGDLMAFVTGGPWGSVQAVNQFLKDITQAYLWYNICHCTVVSTPAEPTAPSAPTDLPEFNPPDVVTRPAVEPCAIINHSPNIQYCSGNNPGLTPGLAIAGRNVTASRVTVTRYASTGAGFPALFDLNWYNNVALIRADRFTVPTGNGTTVVILGGPPSGATQASVFAAGTGSGCCNFDTTLEFFCDGSVPGGENEACCPPDPVLTGMLRQILTAVTLVQRQAVPFAYVPGDSHDGLSGAGEFSVAGVIGAKITITATMPGTVSYEAGNPEHLFGAGWVQWGSADGYSPRIWLDQLVTLTLPDRAGAYTLFAYSLPPGLTVDVLELVREP